MRRSDLPYTFVRFLAGDAPSIGLMRRLPRGDGHVFVWAVSFDEPFHREFLFAWLERNAARWPVWGAIAASQGAAALSRHIDDAVEGEAVAGAPVMIQTYRAAAYLGCDESDLLRFRGRAECIFLFDEQPDPLLAERTVTFVDLGGLVNRMIADAVGPVERPS